MIAVDTNLLVYAHRKDSPWHEQAFHSIRRLAEGENPWAIPWPCLHEFLGIVTHPRIYVRPSLLAEALAQAEEWMRSPSLVLLSESAGTGRSCAGPWKGDAFRGLPCTMLASPPFACIMESRSFGPRTAISDALRG